MAINTVTTATLFSEWKDITNLIITKLGDNDSLTTTEKASLVGAINELDTAIGTLSSLGTTEQGSIVGAINEVLTNQGTLASLGTTAQGSLVAAINEVLTEVGDVTTLNTSYTTDVVGALNEVLSELGDNSTLTTTASNAVAAINELDGEMGDLSTLTTTEKTTIKGAVNELDGEVGDLSTLPTTDKSNLVDSITEFYGDAMFVGNIQYENEESTGGRFATDDLATITVSTFSTAGSLLVAHNSASFGQGAKFINDNTDNGGSAGALDTDISTLLSALDSKGGRTEKRYGYEFYIVDVTAGSGTSDAQTYAGDAQDYHPIAQNSNVMLGRIGEKVTWIGWVRLKTLNDGVTYDGALIGNSNTTTYIDGVVQTDPYLLTVGQGWVHVRQTITLTKEFENIFPAIYANNLDNIQLALSAKFKGDVNIGIHVGIV